MSTQELNKITRLHLYNIGKVMGQRVIESQNREEAHEAALEAIAFEEKNSPSGTVGSRFMLQGFLVGMAQDPRS